MAIYRGSGGSVESITESATVTIAVSQGGTGAQTAAAARTNLGLGSAATTDSGAYATAAQGVLADSALQEDDIGVSIQAYDEQLADVAGLTPTDNGVIIGNGANFGVESGSTLRTSLGLAIGTDVLAPNGSAASLTDFPTLNQNTTGTAANVSGTVAIANGGTGQTTAATARAALLPTYATNGGKVLAVKSDASDVEYISVGGTGTVTSVDMTVPTGLSVSGNPVTTTGTLAVTYASGYAIPTTAKQTEWDTAYTDRNKWDGGATGLTASTGRTSLGVTATGADTTYAYRANNLSDLASASTARTNLGLGTAATTASTDYATAAQGTLADNALTAANPNYTGTLTGGTGVVNLGSGQVYKDASGNVGIGNSSPTCSLDVTGGIKTGRTAVTSPASTDGNVFSGTYTPTLSNTTNVSTSTASACQYMRVGNTVTVSGEVVLAATATGNTVLGISLPIASNIGATRQLGGTAVAQSTTQVATLYGDATNDRVTFRMQAAGTTALTYVFSFTYQVI